MEYIHNNNNNDLTQSMIAKSSTPKNFMMDLQNKSYDSDNNMDKIKQ